MLSFLISCALVFGPNLKSEAQAAKSTSEFEQPYGTSRGDDINPYDATTRDDNYNRLVLNGLIEGGSGLGSGLYTQWGQTQGAYGMLGTGTAIGNQVNVITTGSNNTIVVNARQTNTGNQKVILNGKLNLR